jgi:hypothetical protein
MTIWVFGDSFSKHFDHLPDTWVERTRQIVGQDIQSFSKAMTTLEYSFYKFNEQRPNIQHNDIVIMSITTLKRRWFWPDRPFRGLDLNKEDKNAQDQYEKYLIHFDEVHKVYVTNFLYNLNYLTKKLDLHTIVLFNFYDFDQTIESIFKDLSSLHIARGRVGIASDQEYKQELVKTITTEWFMKWDKRVNHFIRSNHIRISDKIIENIKNKTPIDFSKGLITSLLDDDLLQDPEFVKNELFSDEWKRILG